MPETYTIRSACAGDEATIKAMIRAEHLDPFNVHWQNFLVAEEAGRIIGIGQVKPYRSGRELGSLVVAAERRQNGVGGAIINALIAREHGPLLLFCLAFREPYYARFGFQRRGLRDLPGEFKLKYALGMVFTRLVGRRLIVMQRQ
jgi:N-acetylglutamate synthase-like GNAT family acetyltransferase